MAMLLATAERRRLPFSPLSEAERLVRLQSHGIPFVAPVPFPKRKSKLVDGVDVRDLFAELPFYAGRPEPRLINCPQTRPGELLKNPEWLAYRTEQTASSCGATCGLIPYKNQSPRERYLIMTGQLIDNFNGNEDTEHGELHEPRLRGIFRATTGMRVTEFGLFLDQARSWQGVSPDGVAESVRLKGVLSDGKTPFSWLAGTCMIEAKCSRKHFYKTPKAGHICQIMLQMFVRGTNCGFLVYWNQDRVRIWFVVFSWEFFQWQSLRMSLMHEHVKRRIAVEDHHPYFNDRYYGFNRAVLREPGNRKGWNSGLADELEQRYFYRQCDAKYSKSTPPPLTRADWEDELNRLGMTQEEWEAQPGYSEITPRFPSAENGLPADYVHPAQQFLPSQPEIYLAYQFEREVPAEERKAEDEYWITPVDEEDEEFFENEYMTMTEFNGFQLDLLRNGHDIDADRPTLRVKRLFITQIESVPEAERPELKDMSGVFDTPEAERRYRARLLVEEARFASKTVQRAEEARQLALIAEKIRNDPMPQRQTKLVVAKRALDGATQPREKWRTVVRAANHVDELFEQDQQGPLRRFYTPKTESEPTLEEDHPQLPVSSWITPLDDDGTPMSPQLQIEVD